MKRMGWRYLAVAGLFWGAAAAAQDAGGADGMAEQTARETEAMKKSLDGKARQMLDAPAGVFDIEYDKGSLARLKIKGESEVSTALRGARGERQAREKAQRDAKAAFSKFLNERIVVVESDNEAFIVKEKDGKESAEFQSASAKSVTLFSNAFLRGLVVLMDHVEGEGDRRKAVVVLGWSKKLTDASMKAESDMAAPPPAASAPKTRQPAGGKEPAREADNRTVTRMGNLDGF